MLTGDCNTVNHDGDGRWLLDEEYPEDKMITIIATEVLVCSILHQKVFWSLLTSLRSQPICQQMVITTHPDHCAFARAGSNNITPFRNVYLRTRALIGRFLAQRCRNYSCLLTTTSRTRFLILRVEISWPFVFPPSTPCLRSTQYWD